MENIHVAVRLRPRSKKEEESGEVVPWKIRGNCIEFDDQASGVKKLTKPQFIYDHCFGTATNNEQVYSTCVRRVTMSCLEGYNGTIFMYGQTGSGKTYNLVIVESIHQSLNLAYSMLGYKNQDGGVYNQSLKEDLKTTQIMKEGQKTADAETDSLGMENLHEKYPEMIYDSNKVDISGNTGVLIQSLKNIFESIERDEERTFFLKCSYFEIYNDQIYDLLQARGSMHEPLNLMEDAKKDHFM